MSTLFDLSSFLKEGDYLDLLSVYKGLPVICHAKVIERTKKSLIVLNRSASILPILRNKHAQALGSVKHPPFQCFLNHADVLNGMMKLDAHPLETSSLGERRSLRVEPKENIPVDLKLENTHIPATLLDISIEGMGVSILERFFSFKLKPGTTLQAHLCLSEAEIDVPGRVVGVSRDFHQTRLSVHFSPPFENGRTLIAYIHQRRREIEHELLDEYQAALLWGEIPTHKTFES